MSKRKYKEGKTIKTIDELVTCLNNDKFVYINHKILHREWVLNLQFRYLVYTLEHFRITKADREE